MALAPARVEVDQINQLAHGVQRVAQHLGRLAPGGGNQLVTHHQQAKVVAGQKALDHHRAVFDGGGISLAERGAVADVDRHALALVAVLRLDDHRQANFQRHRPAFVGRGHRTTQRHRHAGGVQQALGQVFVLRNRLGDGAGGINLGGLDAPLL